MGLPANYVLALPLLFVVAALYSSVGHGGASGYWAVFGFLGFAMQPLVPVVLILNILVASVSFLHFRRPGDFKVQRLLPFIVTSIPAAYLGGMWRVSSTVFPFLLGLALLFAGLRLIGVQPGVREQRYEGAELWKIGLPVGFVLGLVSGMIGIGGGVFLSPILIFLCITDVKGSAAMSSAFIVLNSISGFIGQAPHLTLSLTPFIAIVVAGFCGGLVGANWGALKAKTRRLQFVLGSVLVVASVKMISSGIASMMH